MEYNTVLVKFHLTLMLFGICCFITQVGSAQDLPPSVPNLRAFEQGSLVIPLQESLQPDPALEGFNLQAYGLVYYLLDNGIDLYWVIRSGKSQNDIDFTAQAHQILPTSGPSRQIDFISSAFVIDLEELRSIDCENTLDLLQNFKNFISQSTFNNLSIYQLDEDISLDVRYFLDNPPRIAVLNDGFFADSHTFPLNLANIPYELLSSSEFFSNSECFTVITQPHILPVEILNDDYYTNLDNFLANGGNFIAQCSSIETFENRLNYHTDNGVRDVGGLSNFSYNYLAPDMALFQIEGVLPPLINGTVGSFIPNPGSTLRPNAYVGISNTANEMIVSSADVNGPAIGGNMIYIAGHAYFLFTGGTLLQEKQFMRIFINGLFLGGSENFACAGENACICPGDTVQLGCPSLSDQPIYDWTPSEGLSCTDCPFPLASPTQTTTYYQTIAGSSCTIDSVIVFVRTPEKVNLGSDTILCSGDTLFLDLSLAGAQYLWQDGSTMPTYTISNSGTFWLERTFDGCSLRDSITVRYVNEVTAALPRDTVLCSGDTLFLDLSFAGAQYLWQDGSTMPTYTISSSGTFWLERTIDGCSFRDSITVRYVNEVTAAALPRDTVLCTNSSLSLNAQIDPEAQYLWSDGDTNPQKEISNPGIYWVQTTLNNCSRIDTIQIDMEPCVDCSPFIPTAFTPNFDGNNDRFTAYFADDCEVNQFKITIFNRWGDVIAKLNQGEAWDGTFGGEIVKSGVYTYILEYLDETGKTKRISGDITLLR